MRDVFKDIIKYEEGDDFFDDFLKQRQVFDIFKGLLEDFPDKEVFKGCVWFVLWGYSIQSDMLQTTGLTWDKLSKKIFERTGLDDKYFDQIGELECDSVRDAIDRWLIFQNDENWRQFCCFRDLRKQFLAASLLPLPKLKTKIKALDTETPDIEIENSLGKLKNLVEAKMLCATNSEQLLKMMNEAKERFIQTQPKLKVSISELNKVTHNKSTKTTEEIFASHGN